MFFVPQEILRILCISKETKLLFFFDGVIVHSRNLNGIYSVNALFADLIKCISFCEPVEVVDVTAVRQYKVPGTLDCCDVKDFVLECFFGDRRPLTRRRWKRGRRTHIVLSQIPKMSVGVMSVILNFVGHLVNDEGEIVLLGNDVGHFAKCENIVGAFGSAKRCSYGWHDEQLTAAEYVAHVSREVSANLDFMAEARRRPRPGVLHPTATDEKDDVGLKGEFVEAEDMDDVVDQDIEDLEETTSSLRPDIQYKPILQISANDLFDVVHRRDVGTLGSGRASVSTKRSREFMQQYGEKYLEMKEARKCSCPTESDLKQRSAFSVSTGKTAQKRLQESRKEKEEQLMDASDDDMLPSNSAVVEISADLAPEKFVSTMSPAEMALRLLQQRLPTRQTDGCFQISPDQYNACVLAVAPLQRLWIKAGEHNLQHCFGDRARIHDLLQLVTPEPWLTFGVFDVARDVFVFAYKL